MPLCMGSIVYNYGYLCMRYRHYCTCPCVYGISFLFFPHSWYHGMISRPAAEKALGSVKSDCFLVRESQNREGEHSLSLTHSGKVKHFRIDKKQGAKTRYELFGAKRSFLRLSELIDYYSQHCLSADGELLTTPCPNKVCVCGIIKHSTLR